MQNLEKIKSLLYLNNPANNAIALNLLQQQLHWSVEKSIEWLVKNIVQLSSVGDEKMAIRIGDMNLFIELCYHDDGSVNFVTPGMFYDIITTFNIIRNNEKIFHHTGNYIDNIHESKRSLIKDYKMDILEDLEKVIPFLVEHYKN